MKHTLLAILVTALCGAGTVHADIGLPTRPLTAGEFQTLARDMGTALSFPVVDQADPYGLTGFDIGVGYLGLGLDENDSAWRAVDGPSTWHQWYVRAVKGLPAGFDIGAMYGSRMGGDESVLGGELKWAFTDDGLALPAIGLRFAYTQASGIETMDLSTWSAQVQISKSFPFLAPYAGAGYAQAHASSESILINRSETVPLPSGWIGLKLSPFPFVSLTGHAQLSFVGAPLLYAVQLSAGL
jgi:hypothetical protein